MNEAIEFEKVVESLKLEIEARDAAKAALESIQHAQEQLNRRVRELDGLIHKAQQDDRGGLVALQAIAEANREGEACRERLDVLRREETELRSALAKAQHVLDVAALRIIEPLRVQQQAQVSALVDQAYHITDAWRAAMDRIADLHGLEFPTPRHVALNPLMHARVGQSLYGVPPFGQHKEAENA